MGTSGEGGAVGMGDQYREQLWSYPSNTLLKDVSVLHIYLPEGLSIPHAKVEQLITYKDS